MKVDNGSVFFEIGVDNSKINKGLEELKQLLIELQKGTEISSDVIDKSFSEIGNKITETAIKIRKVEEENKKAIGELTNESDKLKSTLQTVGKGVTDDKTKTRLNQIQQEIEKRNENIRIIEEENKRLQQSQDIYKNISKEIQNTVSKNGKDDNFVVVKIGTDASSLKHQIEEVKARLKGDSKEIASQTIEISKAFENIDKKITSTFNEIDSAYDKNKIALKQLQEQYNNLVSDKQYSTFKKFGGYSNEHIKQIEQQVATLKPLIDARKKNLATLEQEADNLLKSEQAFTKLKEKYDKATTSQTTFRTELRNAQNELREMTLTGETTGAKFEEVRNKVVRLTQAMNSATKQTQALASPTAGFQGVLSGLSGLAGGMSAVTGVMGLFASESENLQKIMTKVQSVMAITIGLQQVEQTLLKSSAFQVNVLSKAKQWYNNILKREEIYTRALSIARAKAIATNKIQVSEANKGTFANTLFAKSIRGISTAIKTIPGIGWILALVGALTTLGSVYKKKYDDAKKYQQELTEQQERFEESIASNTATNLVSFKKLQSEYNALGNNIKAKEKYIKDNKDAFRELGISVNGVRSAEKLFNEGADAFCNSLKARAKALAANNSLIKEYEEVLKLEQERDREMASSKVYKTVEDRNHIAGGIGEHNMPVYYTYQEVDVEATKKAQEKVRNEYQKTIDVHNKSIENLSKVQENAIKEEEELLKKSGANKLKITKKQEKQTTDLYKKSLEKKKQAYDEYYKLINSGDEILQKHARSEYAQLLKDGKTYTEYLKKQRDEILKIAENKRTAEQNKNLNTLMNEIANQTNQSVLQTFERSLTESLNGANSLLDKLQIIQDKRKEINKDNEDLASKETEKLNEEEKKIIDEVNNNYLKAQREYTDYLDERLSADEKYFKDRKTLEDKYINATSENEQHVISTQIKTLDNNKALQDQKELDALLEKYRSFNKKKLDLDAQYEKEKQLLEKNYNNGNATFEDYAHQLEALKKEYENKIKELNREAVEETMQNSELLVDLFSNTSEKSISKIKEILRNTKILIDYLKGNKENLSVLQQLGFSKEQLEQLKNSPKDIQAIIESFDKLNETTKQSNPFSYIVDKRREIETLQKSLTDGTERTNKQITDIEDRIKKLKGEVLSAGISIFSTLENALNTLSSAFDKLDNENLKTMFEQVQNSLNIAKSFNETLDAINKGSFDGIVTGFFSFGSAIITTYASISKYNKELKENLEKWENALKNIYKEYQKIVLEQRLAFKEAENIFGTDTNAKINNNIQVLLEAQNRLNDVMKYVKDSWVKVYESYGGSGIGIVDSVARFFGVGDLNNYMDIMQKYPDLIDEYGNLNIELAKLIYDNEEFNSKKQKEQLKEVIDAYEDYEKALEQLNSYLTDMFGELGNTITDVFVDAFANGTDAALSFAEEMSNILESLAKQMMKTAILQPILDKYSKMISEEYKTQTSSEERFNHIAKIMQNLMTDLLDAQSDINDYLSEWQKIAEDNGFSIFNGETNSNNTVGNAVKTITSEEAGIIAGQANAIRIQQTRIREIADNSLSQLVAIRQNSEYLRYLPTLQRIEMLLSSGNKVSALSIRAAGYLTKL